MSLVLGQLVYTSFPKVGYRLFVSTEVPTEIQQVFIQQIVYQHWNSYNPPKPGYQGAYLYQVTPEHSLFGWLYNDGQDDFGRNQVPYFQCYYYLGQLHAVRLEDIFTCLHRGPVALIDGQVPSAALETVVIPDIRSYQPIRIGVAISSGVRDRSYAALKQRRLLDLFIAVDGEIVVELEQYKQQEAPQLLLTAALMPQTPFGQEAIPLQDKSSESHLGAHLSNASTPIFLNKFAKLICIASSIVSVALMINSYYSLWLPAPINKVQQYPDLFLSTNTFLEKITLALTLTGHSGPVWSVALSPDGQTIVSGSGDKTIKVWNLYTGQLIRTLSGHSSTVRSVTFSPNGQTIVSGSADKNIKVWNLYTGQLIRTLTGHSGSVWSIALSSDGQTIVSGSEDKTIKVWQAQTGELVRTLTGHSSQVFSVALSSDGQTIASASKDKTIKLWNVQTGELVRTLTGHSNAVRSVAFSPDAEKLASSSWDKTIKIWNLHTGEQLSTLKGHSDRVVAISFSADGQMLTSASVDKTVKIWSLQTTKLLRDLSRHSDWVLSVTTSNSGQTIVSSSKDKTIKIWR